MSYAPVLGTRLRVSKVDNCGKPIQGAKNRLVTEGFVRVALTPNQRQANELEQNNAAGKVCVSRRTPPERKWWDIEAEFCDVDSELWTLLTGWSQELGWDDSPIGVRDQAEVSDRFGVAMEVWTDIGSDDECAIPTDDAEFSANASGELYGYTFFCAKEFVLGAINIAEAISTFTLSGITMNCRKWGRGPYNVVGTDAAHTPGRLLTPTTAKEHIIMFETAVPPPDATNGACELAVQSIFSDATPPVDYYGPSAAAIAPLQPICDGTAYTVTVTGSPTGGTFTLSVAGDETGDLDYDADADDVRAALEALATVNIGQVTVSGAGPFTVTLSPELGALTADGSGLTGGTDPDVTVVAV